MREKKDGLEEVLETKKKNGKDFRPDMYNNHFETLSSSKDSTIFSPRDLG